MKLSKWIRVLVAVTVAAVIPAAASADEKGAQDQRVRTLELSTAAEPVIVGLDAGQNLLNFGVSGINFNIATYTSPLGVEVTDAGPGLRAQLGLADGSGVLITSINPESELAKAGLQVHDIVLRIGEQ